MYMGKIISAYIMPHPPVLLPQIGAGREMDVKNTLSSMEQMAKEIAKIKPTTIILSSPHAPCFRDFFYINRTKKLSGSFAGFGHPELKLIFENSLQLAENIIRQADRIGLPAGFLDYETRQRFDVNDQLDHGAMVPLWFINREYRQFKLILLSTPFMESQNIYQFGQCIGDAVESSSERVVYIASGDMSHGLTHDAPAGYRESGSDYDAQIRRIVEAEDVHALLSISADEMEQAAECGTRSIIMMYGALKNNLLESRLYSYEGPFGVGYLCAGIQNLGRQESEYVRLARETINEKILYNQRLLLPNWVSEDFLHKQAGVFVSLKRNGQLRGCIGTISPTMKNLAEEIIQNAISAATQDPRFPPLSSSELDGLEISVDVLGKAEPVLDKSELDVKKYGVIVSNGYRRGLLLPDLDGVDNVQQQISIALQKAGILPSEAYSLERFEVIRHH
ncbi:MAG: hypothetical protein PWP10_3982 [Clostridiales bacterium]|jgi:AmmeMemoRadiSam system protein A|nr:hypothetical protein [Clostridiales bacterium]